MKKFLAILLAVIAVVIIAFAAFQATDSLTVVSSQPIRIGVISPLSGEASVYGDYMKDGINLAVEGINSKGGINGRRIELIWEDDTASPAKSLTAAEKLATVDNVDAVIYASGSGATLSGLPVLEKNRTPTVVALASNPKIKLAGDFVFRIMPSDDFEGRQMAEIVKQNGFSRPAILFVNNAWGVGIKDSFTEAFGSNAFEQAMEENSTDVKSQLLKIKSYDPDVLLLPCYVTDCITATKQLYELSTNIPVIAGDVYYNQKILDNVGNSAEGFLAVRTSEEKTNEWNFFRQKFIAKFKKEPNTNNAFAFDAVFTLYYAILMAGTEKEELKNSLYTIDFNGPSGLNKFDSFGEVSKKFEVVQIKNGMFELAKP